MISIEVGQKCLVSVNVSGQIFTMNAFFKNIFALYTFQFSGQIVPCMCPDVVYSFLAYSSTPINYNIMHVPSYYCLKSVLGNKIVFKCGDCFSVHAVENET